MNAYERLEHAKQRIETKGHARARWGNALGPACLVGSLMTDAEREHLVAWLQSNTELVIVDEDCTAMPHDVQMACQLMGFHGVQEAVEWNDYAMWVSESTPNPTTLKLRIQARTIFEVLARIEAALNPPSQAIEAPPIQLPVAALTQEEELVCA